MNINLIVIIKIIYKYVINLRSFIKNVKFSNYYCNK